MRKLLVIASTVAAALALAAAAGAASPDHSTFTLNGHFDDQGSLCGFPIVGDFDFENNATIFFDQQGNVIGLKLHQTQHVTFTGKGVTLREDDHWDVFVAFVDGVPVTSKHVGVEFHLIGPNGRLALLTGQTVFEVVNGGDGPVIVQHGLQLEPPNDAQFCAAFA